jgi:hypothetical protein
MAMGHGESLDDALRSATSNMVEWLVSQYRLTFSDVAQVLGTSAEYKVSVVAFRNAGIVLKIHKDRLRTLKPATSESIQWTSHIRPECPSIFYSVEYSDLHDRTLPGVKTSRDF